jgi:starch phosphorylase
MNPTGQPSGSQYTFTCSIPLTTSGRQGYTVRVLPRHPDLDDPFKLGLILWV